jgi:tetratricopeptide (TPR) repeat protein
LHGLGYVVEMTSDRSYEFEVALSFAGEDRSLASKLANILRRRGVKVFFDEYEKHTLWGKNLYTHLSEIYQNKARYCVMFISQHYATKLWTNHEREAAQARAFLEHEEYILPVHLDDTQIPGIPPTIGYLSWPPETAKTIADAVVIKLGKISSHRVRQAGESATDASVKYYTEMLEAYEQAVQLNPQDAYTYILKGEALYELKRYEEALAAYEKATQLDPDNLSIYINKGQVLSDLDRYEEALDVYDYYLEHTPNDPYVQGCKSLVLADLDRYEEALEASEQSLQLDPDDAIMQGQKAMMLYLLDRSEEALAAYEQAIQLDSMLDWHHQSKGDVLFELSRYEEALAAYEKAIQLDPNYFSAHKGRGNVLYELKRYQDALAAYNRAIQLNPIDADVYVRKGETLKHILADQKNAKQSRRKSANSVSNDRK